MTSLAAYTAILFTLLSGGVAGAQEAQEAPDRDAAAEGLELTMRLLPQGTQRSEIITRTIELPPAASGRGREASEGGRDSNREAGENRRDGMETAAEARERGREFGREMAERARENREDAARGNVPDDLPGPPDDVPGPPDDLPGPPQN